MPQILKLVVLGYFNLPVLTEGFEISYKEAQWTPMVITIIKRYDIKG